MGQAVPPNLEPSIPEGAQGGIAAFEGRKTAAGPRTCDYRSWPNSPLDLAENLSSSTDSWAPKVVARLNDYEIKVVKVQGEFIWHTHDDTDELFLVIDGELTISPDLS